MKATIQNPGIEIDVEINHHIFSFQVKEQSDHITQATRNPIVDEQTGFSLKSHNGPNWTHNDDMKRFYIRGQKAERNDKAVTIAMESAEEANNALLAIQRMLDQISPRALTPEHPGGTTAARMALIKRTQATILCLTGGKHYPDERTWPNTPVEPHVLPVNLHYSEHMGQLVDVLNKAHTGQDECQTEADIINPHKVDAESARVAVEGFKEYIDSMEDHSKKALVAAWRIVSGLRAPDVDENGDGRQ